jgi:peptide/nickel transport system substrate-binding protein
MRQPRRTGSPRPIRAALLAATFLAVAPVAAQAQNLNVGAGGAFTSLDPHFFNLGPNNVLGKYIFSSLTEFSPDLRPEPSLAVSWKAVAPTVWEFKLREGVTFHDGTPLTADDVVFSFERIPTVPNSPGTFAVMIKPVTKLEVIDAHTIRMHTAGPMPVLPLMMVGPMILSRKIHTGATTADFNSGKMAIGTGPYRLQSFTQGDRATFTRNDTWFGPKPNWQTVNYRLIANAAARTAALQAGDVDVIDQVAPRDVAELRKNAKLNVNVFPGQRLIYV